MIKEYLLESYISIFEKVYFSSNNNLRNKMWNKIKNNYTILDYATQTNNKNFKSNIIAYEILKDLNLRETEIYKKIVNLIFKNKELSKLKIKSNSFLSTALENRNLLLSKEQKQFLIFEAENCPHTEKYYQEKRTDETYTHGYGFRDLRYKILKNKSFTIQEKTNLFIFFYPDNEIKIDILNDFEWEIAKQLGIANEKDYSGIYHLEEKDIMDKLKNEELTKEIIDKINLCKNIYSKIPDEEIKKYKNNE